MSSALDDSVRGIPGPNVTHPTYLEIQELLKESFREKQLKCYSEVLSQPPPNDGRVYCNATKDLLGCWNYTLAGTKTRIQCPEFMTRPEGHVYRRCTMNGTWYRNPTSGQFSDYAECRGQALGNTVDGHEPTYIFVAGYSLSIILLAISLFIFFRFSQLRCDRITIHKNLFLSYILTGLSWIFYLLCVAIDWPVIMSNPIWCQALHVVSQYFVVCNFSWMFCEGLYLHTIMVRAFSSGKSVLISCYIIGWVWPLVLVAIYTGVRASTEGENIMCWVPESALQWIMYAPICASMLANIVFLCNIIRLLITKLRQIPEARQTKKAARATLILIPLLGLQFLLIPFRPEKGSSWEDVYHYIMASLVSLQGAFAAIMYCFCNSEVISVLKRKWNQHKMMIGGKRGRTSSTMAATTYTLVDQVSQAQTTVT